MSKVNLKGLKISIDYLLHFISAGDEHSVHSPFVFKLLTECIYNKSDNPAFDSIEKIRTTLLKDTREIEVTDLGAGSTYNGVPKKRKISEIAGNFAKAPKYSRLLFRIVNYLKPATMVELGTSLGISGMYQSAGNPNGTLYTLEGCSNTANEAISNFKKNGFDKLKCSIGNFDATLPELLMQINEVDYAFVDGNHTYDATIRYFNLLKKKVTSTSILIFDDINWSDGMKKAWDEIKSDPDVTVTIDFFLLGLVFFNRDYSKQNFKLRLK